MLRTTMDELVAWKDSPNRKPLILNGARQVGKTWLLKEFGRQHYERVIYLSLDQDTPIRNIFDSVLPPQQIIDALALSDGGGAIDPQSTLVILDEVQERPFALTALKYFQEEAPQYHVATAGSLLGISLHSGASFPVGKVNTIDLYPMSFLEFLRAVDEPGLAELIAEQKFTLFPAFHDRLTTLLKTYYIVGGMPGAVSAYTQSHDLVATRTVQSEILQDYDRDFSKHAPADVVPRIREVWRSIPGQLQQVSNRFMYARVRPGARARSHETALLWLADAGLVHRSTLITTPRLPIRAYEDATFFKLFIHDIGLLGSLSGLDPKTVLESDRLFTEFKGSLTEQYVCQELITSGIEPHYWSNGPNKAEVDFVVQSNGRVIPIEVKAHTNLQAKSLQVYRSKFHPEIAVRTSLAQYEVQPGLVNLPLYAVCLLPSVATRQD